MRGAKTRGRGLLQLCGDLSNLHSLGDDSGVGFSKAMSLPESLIHSYPLPPRLGRARG